MPRERLRNARLVGLAVCALVLFNYPFLAVFGSGAAPAGVPLLWVYLLLAWTSVIAVAAWVVRR